MSLILTGVVARVNVEAPLAECEAPAAMIALSSSAAGVEGVKARVVSPRTLHWLKRETVRDKDRVDARYLAEKFGFKEDDGGR